MTGVSLSRVSGGVRVIVKDGSAVLEDRVFPSLLEAREYAIKQMTEACRAADAQ